MKTNWKWIDREVVLAIHDQQIAEHGGTNGIRDMGLIESALARPRNLASYSESDVFDLAAEYGYGIARIVVLSTGISALRMWSHDFFLFSTVTI